MARAEALAQRLSQTGAVQSGALVVGAEAAGDAVGAGSLPTLELEGGAVTLQAAGLEAGAFARRLRAHRPPVFTTVHDHIVHVHVRTLQSGEEDDVVAAIEAALSETSSGASA